MKLFMLLAAVAVATAPAALAKGKVADCVIAALPGDEVQFQGKCKFVPEGGGSFTLMDAAGGNTLYGAVSMVSVYLTGKDTAEVSGLVLDESGGHNTRWGSAKRSDLDGACWEGDDFRVCAW